MGSAAHIEDHPCDHMASLVEFGHRWFEEWELRMYRKFISYQGKYAHVEGQPEGYNVARWMIGYGAVLPAKFFTTVENAQNFLHEVLSHGGCPSYMKRVRKLSMSHRQLSWMAMNYFIFRKFAHPEYKIALLNSFGIDRYSDYGTSKCYIPEEFAPSIRRRFCKFIHARDVFALCDVKSKDIGRLLKPIFNDCIGVSKAIKEGRSIPRTEGVEMAARFGIIVAYSQEIGTNNFMFTLQKPADNYYMCDYHMRDESDKEHFEYVARFTCKYPVGRDVGSHIMTFLALVGKNLRRFRYIYCQLRKHCELTSPR